MEAQFISRKEEVTDHNGSKSKLFKEKVHDEQIKKPLTSYFYFVKKRREELKVKFPGLSNKLLAVKMGEEWKCMGNAEKAIYEQQAKEDMERYQREKGVVEGKKSKGNAPKKPMTAYFYYVKGRRGCPKGPTAFTDKYGAHHADGRGVEGPQRLREAHLCGNGSKRQRALWRGKGQPSRKPEPNSQTPKATALGIFLLPCGKTSQTEQGVPSNGTY